MLPPTPMHSHSLPFTPTHSHPLLSTPTHSHSFLALSHPLPLMFSSLLLVLNPPPTMCRFSHPFTVHIQLFTLNPTHYLSLQPIFSPFILRAYMFCVPVCLCALVFHAPLCLCNPFLCTLLPMSMYFTCLCVCYDIRTIYLHCAFLKHACNNSVLFLVPFFLPWFLCPCFSVLSSHWCCKSSRIFRTKEKNILKMSLICF